MLLQTLAVVLGVDFVLGACEKKLVTFNAGLLPRIEHYDVRRRYIPSAISDMDADVVCLQEVWFATDMQKIIKATRNSFPFSYSEIHNSDGVFKHPMLFNKPPCRGSLEYFFILCALAKCTNTETLAEYAICAHDVCGMMHIDQHCITCLSLTPTSSIISTCILNAFQKINLSGLLLLSKRPIRNPSSNRFLSDVKQLLPRSYLMGDVERIGTALCTHLTSNLGSTYYEPLLRDRFSSWSEQNMEEVNHLIQLTTPMTDVMLMGDLNTGLADINNDITGEFKDSYNLLISAGFSSAYVTDVGQCTWCVSNPLQDPNFALNLLLDHVMLKGMGTATGERILQTDITGETYPISDHFGVMVTVTTE